MNHQKIKGICRLTENTIKEKHIGKLNGADKDIFAAKRRSDFRGQTIRKFYGALPQAPPTFLKKVGEKQCFTAKYPTHSVRAILGGFFILFCFV